MDIRTFNYRDLHSCLQSGGSARARACLFNKQSGVGAWGSVPLTSTHYGKATEDAEVGLRYSTPAFTAGAVVAPANGVLKQLWLV